jgi:hypothetical protein
MYVLIQHCFIYHPSDSTASEDAGTKPRTVATSALAVRGSSHSASYMFGIRLISWEGLYVKEIIERMIRNLQVPVCKKSGKSV